ncbi:AAA family ATPase [Xanthovirga aplysinae]|uniref:AAA family ATPase n=1 Tax=Xanthovirga aplysinae TaxID=2529853 RepID=UPI0012BC7696|nr:ATP-binding protein [Xanthovirga aplysinae]MTI31738.1 ATPase [Xanthovirga aplysinae]
MKAKSSILRVAITGPESTGKSTLAQDLANYYQTLWVPEFARSYLNQLDRPYREEDLVEIAKGQIRSEEINAKKANKLLICDTELTVLKIWSEYKYGQCHPWIIKELLKHSYDLYLLTSPDIPWEDDPLREHPEEREKLFDVYLKELKGRKLPISIISGTPDIRKSTAIRVIDHLL